MIALEKISRLSIEFELKKNVVSLVVFDPILKLSLTVSSYNTSYHRLYSVKCNRYQLITTIAYNLLAMRL